MGEEGKTLAFMQPLLLDRCQEMLHCENEQCPALRRSLLASPLKRYVVFRCASPDLWVDVIVNELSCEIELETWVHGGVVDGLYDGALCDSVKGFLQIDLEDGERLVPFQVDFDSALNGVQCFRRLSVASVAALCFGDL